MQDITVLHTGDNHLGFRQYGFAVREGDFYASIQNLCKKALALGVDAVLIAGDLFDATKPPAIAVKVVQSLVGCLKDYGVRVLAIDGNHDVSGGDWLEICGIEHIGGKVVTITSKDGTNKLNIGGIDSCRPGVFYSVLEQLKAYGPTPVHVLAIHQAVAELADYSSQDYTALQMAPRLLEAGVQYVAMGDIHAYKETVIGGVRFAYCGSSEVNATDEPMDKSANLIKFDGTTVRTGVVPLDTRPFIVVTLEKEADIEAVLAQAQAAAVPPVVAGWYGPEAKDIARRAEALLQSRGIMTRIQPFARGSSKDGAQARVQYDRSRALLQLKDAVTAYFEEGSDEFQLVFQLLNAPENVKETMAAYLKSKGL